LEEEDFYRCGFHDGRMRFLEYQKALPPRNPPAGPRIFARAVCRWRKDVTRFGGKRVSRTFSGQPAGFGAGGGALFEPVFAAVKKSVTDLIPILLFGRAVAIYWRIRLL
jgi:hypothetical protein